MDRRITAALLLTAAGISYEENNRLTGAAAQSIMKNTNCAGGISIETAAPLSRLYRQPQGPGRP